jgi:hypothetical protein
MDSTSAQVQKTNSDDDIAFEFNQNLYEEALGFAENDDDPWKDLSGDDFVAWQEEEAAGNEYVEEVPMIESKPTTECVIIDNEHGEIRRCNQSSAKRLQELLGVWEIDASAVADIKKELHLLGVCMNHFNYDQNTLHSKKLKSSLSPAMSQIGHRICFFCNRKKIFFSRGPNCMEHTWNIYDQILQVPCRGMVCCSSVHGSSYTEKTQNIRGIRYVCCECYEKNGGHQKLDQHQAVILLHTRPPTCTKTTWG